MGEVVSHQGGLTVVFEAVSFDLGDAGDVSGTRVSAFASIVFQYNSPPILRRSCCNVLIFVLLIEFSA